jgi:hypothetical protein
MKRTALIFMASLGLAPAYAQALRDPTQPPSAAVLSARGGDPAATDGPTLNSVIVSGARTFATIDGKLYRTGDKLGDATVVAIAPEQVTLRRSSGIQVLKLYPQVRRPESPLSSGAAAAVSKAGKRGER